MKQGAPPVTIVEIIDKKRRGKAHTQAEIQQLVTQMMNGEAADYQISAWLMAVCIQGLTLDETTWLTDAFVKSGEQLDLSDVDGLVVDKHSTGGVGDKTTLVLVPMLAACGVKVVKLAGRGLGFTGGTIDKLEAIPGFQVELSHQQMIGQLNSIGAAISAQTANLTPADGKMYALRDVTATVDHIPLIAASVVSKKIATGAKVIVLDIKCGQGAFMKTLDEAQTLAKTCREIGKRLGVTICTVISSMAQPLGNTIGHTLEVVEAVDTLQNQGPKDLVDLCVQLGNTVLLSGGVAHTQTEAETCLRQTLVDGSALQKFRELVAAQGGDAEIIINHQLMPQPQQTLTYTAPADGFIQGIDPLLVAKAAKLLGAGRTTKADKLDLSVGVRLHHKVGDAITTGDLLAELSVGQKHSTEAIEAIHEAFTFSDQPVTPLSLILDVVDSQTLQTV